jgi:hypothetical protein
MSRARVRGTQRKSHRVGAGRASSTGPIGDPIEELLYVRSRNPKFHRFIGVSLGGGKTEKTCLSVIEYYPEQRKIFLSRLFDRIRSDGEISADLQIHGLITQCPPPVENVAFDVPLQLPKCQTCRLRCPGYEECQEPEILWMWKHYRSLAKKKSPLRLFTPYTERCVEQYLGSELEEPFHLPHALGANLAPLTARALFLARRLEFPLVEVFPKLSLWRIGNALNMPKSHLRFHRHWEGGNESRQLVIQRMMDKNLAFIYDQDIKLLIDSPQAFDSFLCALTGLLDFLGHTEPRPKGFPRRESWLSIPKRIFPWP